MPAPCEVCGQLALRVVVGYERLRRVTSDCRPFASGGHLYQCGRCQAVQKCNDAAWQADCATIYDTYDSYGLTGGIEQSVRSGDGRTFAPRSEIVLQNVVAWAGLPRQGRILDFGCGKGSTSCAASRVLPGWSIDGFDQDDRALVSLSAIPNFERLYTHDVTTLPDETYDVIVLMHVLEHLPHAAATLLQLAAKLRQGGSIVIQVPDRDANPYDLLVADHLIHFDLASLAAVGTGSGLVPVQATRSWVGKELSMVLTPEGSAVASAPASDVTADSQVAWLLETAAIARRAATHQPFCIFGTSIVGTWLASELDQPPDLYLDEDPAKIGRRLDGVAIVAPADAPRGATVALALAPAAAEAVTRRLAPLGLDFVKAPPYPLA